MTFNEFRQIIVEIERLGKRIERLEEKIDKMASSTGAGLQALQQADADLTAAITDNTNATQEAIADIETLLSEAGEDATVASVAADISTKLQAIKANTAALVAAVAPPATPPAASTPPASPNSDLVGGAPAPTQPAS